MSVGASKPPGLGGAAGRLDVNPADLRTAADLYAELQARAAAIGPHATAEIERVIATHGVMGYPVAVGMLANLSRRNASVLAKAAEFGLYSQRFIGHAGAYTAQDHEGAQGYDRAKEGVDELDYPSSPEGDSLGDADSAVSEAERRNNQSEAFEQVFGRAPTSHNDWLTAAALDPHSYNAKNQGEPPNIAVARINPVPGQGVVRSNLFIPGETAAAPNIDPKPGTLFGLAGDAYDANAGDNRGFSATAGPEDSRVTIHTDYDNGIIVARQNPSVNLETGEVATGNPTVSAIQTSDGSVLIQYDAADPLSPGGEALAKASPWSVNGTLAIAPSEHGPQIGGQITTFPAMEIYNDRPGVNAEPLLQSWPSFTDNSLGPLVGLPFDKTVGDYSLVSDFNSYFPDTSSHQATLNPSTGPTAIPPVPPMTVVPPTNLTQLGPVNDAPQVVVRDPVHINRS